MMRSAIPILTSSDLDGTVAFWGPVGFNVVERHTGYLVTTADDVEIHFTHGPIEQPPRAAGTSPALAFIHVQDAAALWKRLKAAHTTGLGPVQDQDHGLREFILTDPDGNQVRFGSAIRP
ncbi:VOC family protein [Pengzhenrongella sp.]|jgi:uncharacterized glyoxalase superfamily protein PhnB|uniref:VOC family protein n=1 Tax=Pengzhenrongella sp. TaxID=2888820 RepID=UPI002F948D4F